MGQIQKEVLKCLNSHCILMELKCNRLSQAIEIGSQISAEEWKSMGAINTTQ